MSMAHETIAMLNASLAISENRREGGTIGFGILLFQILFYIIITMVYKLNNKIVSIILKIIFTQAVCFQLFEL